MKLEVGMYCYNKYARKNGIGKIKYILSNNVIIAYKKKTSRVSIKKIVASFNPIDLIEIGDIIIGIDGHIFEVYAVGNDCVYINELKELILINEIKGILTHEQFENNCYKIGDE